MTVLKQTPFMIWLRETMLARRVAAASHRMLADLFVVYVDGRDHATIACLLLHLLHRREPVEANAGGRASGRPRQGNRCYIRYPYRSIAITTRAKINSL